MGLDGGPRSRVRRVRELHVAQQTLVSGSRQLAWMGKDSEGLSNGAALSDPVVLELGSR